MGQTDLYLMKIYICKAKDMKFSTYLSIISAFELVQTQVLKYGPTYDFVEWWGGGLRSPIP